MIKFVWCLGHHGNGRFTQEHNSIYGHENNSSVWSCLDCDAVMVKTKPDTVTEDGWRLLGEVTDDS